MTAAPSGAIPAPDRAGRTRQAIAAPAKDAARALIA
jgi:hypothetical protein